MYSILKNLNRIQFLLPLFTGMFKPIVSYISENGEKLIDFSPNLIPIYIEMCTSACLWVFAIIYIERTHVFHIGIALN